MSHRKPKMDAFTARFYAKAGSFDVKPVTKKRRKAVTALSLTSKTNFREALRDAQKTTKSRLKGIE